MILLELTADIETLEQANEANYSMGLLERSYKLLDLLRSKLFEVETPLLLLEQAKMVMDSTTLEVSVETQENKNQRSEGVGTFKEAFQKTKDDMVALKRRMTNIFEENAVAEAHHGNAASHEEDNVTVRPCQDAPGQHFSPNADLKLNKLFITSMPYQFSC